MLTLTAYAFIELFRQQVALSFYACKAAFVTRTIPIPDLEQLLKPA
jgi:hypothetical protein